MRILWWTERFWPYIGGIETLSLAVIPVLQAMGHEIEVVTSHSSAELPDTDLHQSIPINRFHFLTALHDGNLRQLLTTRQQLTQLKRRFNPDLVHIHFSGASPLFHWQTEAAHPCPTLVSLHSLPSQQTKHNSLLSKTLRQADWVSSVSAHMLATAQTLEPVIEANSSVVYNGMTRPTTTPSPFPSHPVLLCIGRMVAWKRFAWAIEIFSAIHQQHPAAQLVLAGDGIEREALERQVSQLGLQQNVTFAGMLSQDEVFEQLNRSTMVLLPSAEMENIPYVAVEAGWMARPVVASNVSGLPEIIVDGETGYLVAPTDKAAWLARILSLLANPLHAQQLGEQAHQHVSQKFSLGACATQYDALYHQLGATV